MFRADNCKESICGKNVAPGNSRDLRLDFLRGFVLLIVLVDHIEDETMISLMSSWTPRRNCFFDGAEVFVFLSGLVFGRCFQEKLKDVGFATCQKKAVGRALRIYQTYLLTVLVAIGVGVCLREYSPQLESQLELQAGIANCLLWALPMCYQPYGFPILSTYAIILPFMPSLLYWQSRNRLHAWTVPLGLYISVQSLPGLQLPTFPWGQEWYFNPFAWQLLFFIGLSTGTSRFYWTAHWGTRSVLLIGSWAALILGILIRNEYCEEVFGFDMLDQKMRVYAMLWGNKSHLGPLRLVHFASFVFVLSAILPSSSSKVWRTSLLAPVIKCGQHSLNVYSFGLILMLLTIPVFHLFGTSTQVILMVDFDCCAISVCFAYFLERYERSRQFTKSRRYAATGPLTGMVGEAGSLEP